MEAAGAAIVPLYYAGALATLLQAAMIAAGVGLRIIRWHNRDAEHPQFCRPTTDRFGDRTS